MNSVVAKALLDQIVDYAGLFPPAGLPMAAAVANYARYRASVHAGMLGCFVVPAARLPEFVEHATGLADAAADTGAEPWPLSLLVAGDIAATVRTAEEQLAGRPFRVAAVECKSVDLATDARDAPASIDAFFELAPDAALPCALELLRDHGRFAKVRTGSVRAEEIPGAAEVAAFIDACARLGVPFKATAGLHHPVRDTYPLTYEPDAPRGRMHGFLNVFLAAALRQAGMLDAAGITTFLELDSPVSFQLEGDTITAGDRHLDRAQIAAGRRLLRSFGSCSFEEPVDDLKGMQWL